MPRLPHWLVATLLGAPIATPQPERIAVPPAPLPRVGPASVAMSGARLQQIDGVVERAIAAGGFPGAAVVIGRRGGIVYMRGFGTLDWGPSAPVDPETTLYDLASITKVAATATAAMLLVDRGQLDLDAPVRRYLPGFRGGGRSRVTVRQLLTHRSGLPAGRDLRQAPSIAAARALVLRTPLARAPGTRGVYSDLGPDVLGMVIERITGEPLDAFLRHAVWRPLGLANTMFRPPARIRARVAPTRGAAGRGLVHDGNAAALGGVAGHAGLFATASDLATLAQFMLDRGRLGGVRLVADGTVAEFTRRQAGWEALGWETCAGGGSCGHYMDSTAFGHTGFTGTSLWIDPHEELFVVVLTNWVRGGPGGRAAPVAILHDTQADIADLAELAILDHGTLPPMPMPLRSTLQVGWKP